MDPGSVRFDGRDVLARGDDELRTFRWKDASVIFQGAMNALKPVRRVGDLIAEVIMLHDKVDKAEALRLVDPRRASGLVSFEGKDVYAMDGQELKAFRRAAQIVFQDPYQSLDPTYRTVDAVAEPFLVHGIGARSELSDRAALALESAGLRPAETYLDRYPHELSGEQRQRLAIASAMVLEPRMIIADEPVSMLDLSVRTGILKLLARFRDERGLLSSS